MDPGIDLDEISARSRSLPRFAIETIGPQAHLDPIERRAYASEHGVPIDCFPFGDVADHLRVREGGTNGERLVDVQRRRRDGRGTGRAETIRTRAARESGRKQLRARDARDESDRGEEKVQGALSSHVCYGRRRQRTHVQLRAKRTSTSLGNVSWIPRRKLGCRTEVSTRCLTHGNALGICTAEMGRRIPHGSARQTVPEQDLLLHLVRLLHPLDALRCHGCGIAVSKQHPRLKVSDRVVCAKQAPAFFLFLFGGVPRFACSILLECTHLVCVSVASAMDMYAHGSAPFPDPSVVPEKGGRDASDVLLAASQCKAKASDPRGWSRKDSTTSCKQDLLKVPALSHQVPACDASSSVEANR